MYVWYMCGLSLPPVVGHRESAARGPLTQWWSALGLVSLTAFRPIGFWAPVQPVHVREGLVSQVRSGGGAVSKESPAIPKEGVAVPLRLCDIQGALPAPS